MTGWKEIELRGLMGLQPLEGTSEWYWSVDYVHGDLYEAEELYRDGHAIDCNTLLYVHYPDGAVYEPAERKKGRYFGLPAYVDGGIAVVMADFPEDLIKVLFFDGRSRECREAAVLPRSAVTDCYNLHAKGSPLMLTRAPGGNDFEIIWPERKRFTVGRTETFNFREGSRLYFTVWYEDPDYREETIVRTLDGEFVEQYPGDIRIMPNGEKWHLGDGRKAFLRKREEENG